MKYGLIGETLSHSFSAQIHKALSGEDYVLKEIRREQLAAFLQKRDFCAINVTIPYKEEVIPFLDVIDERAKSIGAVNTVVNRGGKLFGYNTDYWGLRALIEKNKLSLAGKTVLILGSGGTSLTAQKVAEDLGAAEVLRVSRGGGEGLITYPEAIARYSDASVIINTTPVGMYPHCGEVPVELAPFTALEAVFDAVYNPLRTALVLQAQARGILAEGGLYMLTAQAVYASEYFLNKTYAPEVLEEGYRRQLLERENIVLTGMPGSGKTTVGKLLAASLGRDFVDTDALIVEREQREIAAIFAADGEAYFRNAESEVIAAISQKAQGLVIATGGGAVLRAENVAHLKQNGKIYFLNRCLEDLIPTADRPLAADTEALTRRFEERFALYCRTADKEIVIDADAAQIAARIRKDYTF